MRRGAIAITSTGVLALSLIVGTLALNGGIPGVQAMSMVDSIVAMPHDGHNVDHMRGTSGHHRAYGECDHADHSSMHRGDQHSHKDCPSGHVHGIKTGGGTSAQDCNMMTHMNQNE